ncbi:hypothetical protein ACGFY9_34525 [Streptomyces sp. NPDC048504]|uniref:hypothetical protein n=1 Tax=Streptomyces sp. NPDC048504 TaxID=3365559 RepID=UPI003718B2D3
MTITTTPTRRRGGSGLLMAAPALLLFGLFGFVPLVGVAALGVARWDGLGSISWTGVTNWTSVLTDSATWQSLWLTVKVMVVSWLVQTPSTPRAAGCTSRRPTSTLNTPSGRRRSRARRRSS